MSAKKVTSTKSDGPSLKAVHDKLGELDGELMECHATLRCAEAALVNAEDGGFDGEDMQNLASAAISVVRRCCLHLAEIEETVGQLNVDTVDMSPQEART